MCAHSPIPVSVKTRIGYDDPAEWEALLRVYSRYPLARLIVHPRTCRERYQPGKLHPDCAALARQLFSGPLVVNGDIFTTADAEAALPGCGLMLGRGLVAQPAMARQLNGGAPLQKE